MDVQGRVNEAQGGQSSISPSLPLAPPRSPSLPLAPPRSPSRTRGVGPRRLALFGSHVTRMTG